VDINKTELHYSSQVLPAGPLCLLIATGRRGPFPSGGTRDGRSLFRGSSHLVLTFTLPPWRRPRSYAAHAAAPTRPALLCAVRGGEAHWKERMEGLLGLL